jgi:hypothetical protein
MGWVAVVVSDQHLAPPLHFATDCTNRFLLEAIPTLIIGVLSWVVMPPGPTQTRNWFRGKNGWFTDREEFIMVNRLLRDDPSKGDMNNRYAIWRRPPQSKLTRSIQTGSGT